MLDWGSHTHGISKESLQVYLRLIKFLWFVKVVLGKSTKLSFLPRTMHAYTFLHQLHMDVWGLTPIISYDAF